MEKKILTKGLFFKRPNPKAPEFVKGSLSIKVEEFMQFMNDNQVEGWVNIDLLEGKPKGNEQGSYYATLNTWQPDKARAGVPTIQVEEEPDSSSIPF